MGKMIISSVLSVCFLTSINADIISLVKNQTGTDVEVLSKTALKTDSNLQIVTIKDKDKGYRALILTNKKENILFGINSFTLAEEKSDQELINDEMSLNMQINNTLKTHSAVLEAIKQIPKDYIISLKGKSDKTTFYIISDPLCPHCQAELNNLEKRLATGNVKLIPIGLLDEQSAKKAQEIHNSLVGIKDDAKKIEIIRKIYKDSYVSNIKDTDKIRQITSTLTGKGKVEAVPYIIESNN